MICKKCKREMERTDYVAREWGIWECWHCGVEFIPFCHRSSEPKEVPLDESEILIIEEAGR